MDVGRGVQAVPGVPVLVGVPGEEAVAELAGVLEANRSGSWAVLQGLELGLAVRVCRWTRGDGSGTSNSTEQYSLASCSALRQTTSESR